MTTQMNELAFYTLAGAPESPQDLLDEVKQGEALGFGSMFISERFNIKEAATLSGAAGAVSTRLGIATAATNHNTRHPMVSAAFAMTMHKLTGGRFSLGLGRGIAPVFDAYGLPRITTAQIEDFVGLMRRIWAGEAVISHQGPCGNYPYLSMGPEYNEHIPMTFTAFEIHKDLVNEGFDPKSDNYYSEVNKRIKVDFPHKFAIGGEVEQTSKTNQLVASAQRSVKPGRNVVRLTSSQVAIAKKLGVPLEEYAKQLKLTEGA